MEAKAKATYVRISPRKVQIVLDLIRNQPADKAMAILKFTHKAACEPVSRFSNQQLQTQRIILIWTYQDW